MLKFKDIKDREIESVFIMNRTDDFFTLVINNQEIKIPKDKEVVTNFLRLCGELNNNSETILKELELH